MAWVSSSGAAAADQEVRVLSQLLSEALPGGRKGESLPKVCPQHGGQAQGLLCAPGSPRVSLLIGCHDKVRGLSVGLVCWAAVSLWLPLPCAGEVEGPTLGVQAGLTLLGRKAKEGGAGHWRQQSQALLIVKGSGLHPKEAESPQRLPSFSLGQGSLRLAGCLCVGRGSVSVRPPWTDQGPLGGETGVTNLQGAQGPLCVCMGCEAGREARVVGSSPGEWGLCLPGSLCPLPTTTA